MIYARILAPRRGEVNCRGFNLRSGYVIISAMLNDEFPEKLISALGTAALAAAFAQTGALDDMAPYSDTDLHDYYGIDPAACESIVGYTDAVGYTNELLIIQADEKLAAELETQLAGYLEDRAAQFAGYDADAEALVRQAVLRRDGGVVLMIVSPQADALLEVYRGFTF